MIYDVTLWFVKPSSFLLVPIIHLLFIISSTAFTCSHLCLHQNKTRLPYLHQEKKYIYQNLMQN